MIISNGNDNIVQNVLKKDDGLTIDSVDFWSPHSRNKGGMRISGVQTKVVEILILSN